MDKPDGGHAFPQPVEISGRGMSLRDYFAAAALAYPGVYGHARNGSGYWAEWVAYHAYQVADAMLAERDK